MRLKTFTAPDMAAALRLIKHDLGPDAVILSTRKIKGANGAPTLEITAALDRTTTPDPTATVSLPAMQQPATPHIKAGDLTATLANHSLLPEYQTKLAAATEGVVAAGFGPADALEMVLGKMVNFQAPARQIARGQAHVFVGPTGAGKTTFLCKLAVARRKSGASIGLMSLDDQKIAGFEPLNIVAEALGEQAHLIRTPADLAAAAQNMGQRHYLFIDTPGLNPRKPEEFKELATRLQQLGLPLTVHLILPAHLNESDMAAMPYAFRALNPASLIFTKLDETTRFGPMASVLMAQNLACGLVSDSPAIQEAPTELSSPLLAAQLATAPQPIWEVSA